jgi:hypothetical protein
MHEIKNLTNSPYDLDTVDGSVRLPAMGSVKGKFEPVYLEALRSAGMYEVLEAASAKPKKG